MTESDIISFRNSVIQGGLKATSFIKDVPDTSLIDCMAKMEGEFVGENDSDDCEWEGLAVRLGNYEEREWGLYVIRGCYLRHAKTNCVYVE